MEDELPSVSITMRFLGQAAPHGMDCQRSARQHALGCVGQGQHPFGMQVAFVQGGDEVQDVVSPEPLPG